MIQPDEKDGQRKLRVLNLEDSPTDGELIEAELETEWDMLELLRVDNREAFVRALEEFRPDVVLCDFRLPDMDGREALDIVRHSHPEIPVVMVTGALGDIEAVELVKTGAKDYVMKDHLHRLNSAIQGALSREQAIRNRKAMESALRESNVLHEALMSTANDAIVCTHPDGTIYLWNRKAEEMFGYSADDAIGKVVYELLVPERYRKVASEAMQQLAQTGKAPIVGTTGQFSALRKDGSEFPVELSISAMNIHGEWHATGIIRDITERRQAEASIRRLNQLYASLSQCSQAIVRSKSEQELFEQVCRSAVEFGGFSMAWIGQVSAGVNRLVPVASLGIGAEEYLGGLPLVAGDDGECGGGLAMKAMRENRAFWCQDLQNMDCQTPLHERAVSLGWRSSAMLPLSRDGSVTGIFMLFSAELNAFDKAAQDLLTEMAADINYALDHFSNEALRKRTEEELRKLSQAVEQSSSSIVITDLDANLEYVNEAFVRSTGYSRAEAIGRNPRILHSGKNPRAVYDDMWAHLTRGEMWKGEFINQRKDGSEYTESILISPVRDADGKVTHYLGIKEDITERKRMEAQLVAQYRHVEGINAELMEANRQLKQAQSQLLQSEKMAAIGQLAAGVAHEINNPIGYVNSNLGTLEKYLADIFVIIDKFEAIEELVGSNDPLVEELRRFKAKADLGYIREDIKSLLAESHQGLERVKKIILDLKEFSHRDTGDQWVWVDVHHGLESTLNIVWNELKYKCEVVKEYGELPDIYCIPSQLNQVFMNLLVNAAQAIEVRGKITLRTGQQGDGVWIEVSDTGKGIPPENMTRLFEPFFTTKPVGQGTGLGLTVSYKIIEKHHGRIEVQSEAGKGTTFRIWLPVQQPHTQEKA